MRARCNTSTLWMTSCVWVSFARSDSEVARSHTCLRLRRRYLHVSAIDRSMLIAGYRCWIQRWPCNGFGLGQTCRLLMTVGHLSSLLQGLSPWTWRLKVSSCQTGRSEFFLVWCMQYLDMSFTSPLSKPSLRPLPYSCFLLARKSDLYYLLSAQICLSALFADLWTRCTDLRTVLRSGSMQRLRLSRTDADETWW